MFSKKIASNNLPFEQLGFEKMGLNKSRRLQYFFFNQIFFFLRREKFFLIFVSLIDSVFQKLSPNNALSIPIPIPCPVKKTTVLILKNIFRGHIKTVRLLSLVRCILCKIFRNSNISNFIRSTLFNLV